MGRELEAYHMRGKLGKEEQEDHVRGDEVHCGEAVAVVRQRKSC